MEARGLAGGLDAGTEGRRAGGGEGGASRSGGEPKDQGRAFLAHVASAARNQFVLRDHQLTMMTVAVVTPD